MWRSDDDIMADVKSNVNFYETAYVGNRIAIVMKMLVLIIELLLNIRGRIRDDD